jgi:GntR family transcriptional regulator/MocR family aminotransferase
VLVEPVDHFNALSRRPLNCFRLGVSAIPADRIRAGVAELAGVVRELTAGATEHLDSCHGRRLLADDIRVMLPGASMTTKRVYGEPLEIRWGADGAMTGRAGLAGEDQDSGRWWLDGDRYVRQWNRWSYGETASYALVLDGSRLKFYLESGHIEDTLTFHPRVDDGGPATELDQVAS